MAYDPALAVRVRRLVAERPGVTEKAMFGGLAFLLGGRMFCGVLGLDLLARVGLDLLARVGPGRHDAAMAQDHVRIMDFTGRPMRGYVFVGPEAVSSRRDLTRWVEDCARFVATFPDTPATPRKRAVAGPRPSAASSRSARKAPP